MERPLLTLESPPITKKVTFIFLFFILHLFILYSLPITHKPPQKEPKRAKKSQKSQNNNNKIPTQTTNHKLHPSLTPDSIKSCKKKSNQKKKKKKRVIH